MEVELSVKQLGVVALITAFIALIVALYSSYTVLAFRKHSVVVSAEIVSKRNWNSANLKFLRPDGRQVDEYFGGAYLGYGVGDQVPLRISLTDNSARVDNFLTNWALVIAAGWITLVMTYVGIANLYFYWGSRRT